jgi:four helix bundle protein
MSNIAINSYRDLIAWQKAMSLAELIYRITSRFPSNERFGLTSQMRRAAVSIVSNIAEGNARNTRGEYVQFVGHARGSVAELETQATLALRLGLLPTESEQMVFDQLDEVGRLLTALRAALNASE